MTGDEKLLSDYKPMEAVTVTVANGDRLNAAAMGSTSSPGVQGIVTLTGVLYHPGLHRNLIFVPKLFEKGLIKKKSNCLWHQRFGHLGTKVIFGMTKKKIVSGNSKA